jgi:hypothetical protein
LPLPSTSTGCTAFKRVLEVDFFIRDADRTTFAPLCVIACNLEQVFGWP